jgi:hypothetical protein
MSKYAQFSVDSSVMRASKFPYGGTHTGSDRNAVHWVSSSVSELLGRPSKYWSLKVKFVTKTCIKNTEPSCTKIYQRIKKIQVKVRLGP